MPAEQHTPNYLPLRPPSSIIPDLVLTSQPEVPPTREDFLIAELERRFGGRVGRELPLVEIANPDEYGGEPDWARFGFRGQVGKLLWARGFEKKAIRFVSCNKHALSGVCSRYPEVHKFFIPKSCEVVFCKKCADESRRALLNDYWHVVCNTVLDFAGERKEHELLCELLYEAEGLERLKVERRLGELWARVGRRVKEKNHVLARVTFTLRTDGREIMKEQVSGMNRCIRTVMRRTVGSPMGYGMLFVDEVGFEKRGHLPDAQRVAHGLNLHAHGLYFGPRLDWERTRDLWMQVTHKTFGVESRGFYITAVKKFTENPGRAIRWALNHMLKYTAKPPAVTAERLASLIAAFHGARRIDSLGLFYGKKPKRKKKDCPCPTCRAMGIVSVVGFEGRELPSGGFIPRLELIDDLLARGYIPLRGEHGGGKTAVLSMGVSREASWGQSP